MKVLKFIITWQFWASLVTAALILYGLLAGVFGWLNSYTNHGKQVEIPNIMNLTLDQAVQNLKGDMLDYDIDTSKYDPQYKPYQILDVYPIIGSKVKEGRRIFIRANAKTWKPVAMPNIVKCSKYLAFSQLNLVDLKVSDTIYEPSMSVNTVLRVLYKGKEIQAGMMLPRFTGLTLVIGQGLAKNVIVPTLIGLDEGTARNIINENMFTVGNVIYDNDDPDYKAKAHIYYQVPVPKTLYDQGQVIDMYLSAKPLDSLKRKIHDLDYTFNKQYIKDTLGNVKQTGGTDIIPNPAPQTNPTPAPNNQEKPKTPPKKVIAE